MKPGDIILIRDPDVKLRWKIDYWIHTMMYIDKEKGQHKIIESCGGGVHETTLEEIFNKYNVTNWTVLRVKKRNDKPNTGNVVEFVKKKAENNVPFDDWSIYRFTKQYEPPENHPGYGYYCGELVWAAYISEDIDIDPNKRGWITDWEIYTSPEIERVYVQHPFNVWLFKLLKKDEK